MLSAGPTPRSSLATWSFALTDEQGKELHRWSWGTVRNRLDYVFCDAENGVWVVAGPKTVERYVLPAKEKR